MRWFLWRRRSQASRDQLAPNSRPTIGVDRGEKDSGSSASRENLVPLDRPAISWAGQRHGRMAEAGKRGAAKMTRERRREIAKKAAAKRRKG